MQSTGEAGEATEEERLDKKAAAKEEAERRDAERKAAKEEAERKKAEKREEKAKRSRKIGIADASPGSAVVDDPDGAEV